MPTVAKLRHLRIAPRKVRLVSDLIRGKKATEAQTLLKFLPKRASLPISKLLKSAISSAKNNLQLDENNLYISKITVDEGPKLKRWRPRARGQAYEIQKKTSHITIILDTIEKKPIKKRKTKKEKVERERVEKIEKTVKKERPKFRPEKVTPRPRAEKGIRRIFKRKAF